MYTGGIYLCVNACIKIVINSDCKMGIISCVLLLLSGRERYASSYVYFTVDSGSRILYQPTSRSSVHVIPVDYTDPSD